MPVVFPPGCTRLLTIPTATGSPTPTKTIENAAPTLFAANVAGVPAVTRISAPVSINSRAILRSRSGCSSAQRSRTTRSRSWTLPNSSKPWRNASSRLTLSSREPDAMKPMRGILRAPKVDLEVSRMPAPMSRRSRRLTGSPGHGGSNILGVTVILAD